MSELLVSRDKNKTRTDRNRMGSVKNRVTVIGEKRHK